MSFNTSMTAVNGTVVPTSGLWENTTEWLAEALNSSTTASLLSTTSALAKQTPKFVDNIGITNLQHIILPYQVWKTLQVTHTILTVVALATNCVSLIVIYGIVARLTPPLQLLTSLAFADMLAPWAIMTMYFPASSCQDEIHSALLLTSHNASALTLLAFALCLNIATFRPLHYEKIVTQKRLWIIISVVWILSIITAHIHFLAVLTHHDYSRPFCTQVLEQTGIGLAMAGIISAVTLFVCVLLYGRIMMHMRPIRALINPEQESRKSTRGVITGIMLLATFHVAWIPYLICKVIQVRDQLFRDEPMLIGLNVCQVFVLFNAIFDPIIYGARMANMQTGYLGLYHKCRGWAVVTWHRVARRVDNDDLPSTPLNPIESIC